MGFLLFSGFWGTYEEPASSILLDDAQPSDRRQNYQRLIECLDRDQNCEQDKINYLISRIEKSPCLFIRNGQEVKGSEAARFMRWKLLRKAERHHVRTAEDFVRRIATRSDMSGKYYWVATQDNGQYHLGDVLLNELMQIENLTQDHLSLAQAKHEI